MAHPPNKRPVVWIMNQSYQHDYSKAKKFGELREVTRGPVNIFNPEKIVPFLNGKLSKVKQEDYLLICGHTLLNFFAINEVLQRYNYAKLLVYGAKYKDYRVVKISREFLQENSHPTQDQ